MGRLGVGGLHHHADQRLGARRPQQHPARVAETSPSRGRDRLERRFEIDRSRIARHGLTVGGRVDREEINSFGKSPFDPAAEGRSYLEELSDPASTTDGPLRRAFTAYEGIDDFTQELVRITGQKENLILSSLASITRQSSFWHRKRIQENINVSNTNFSPFLSIAWDPWGNSRHRFLKAIC